MESCRVEICHWLPSVNSERLTRRRTEGEVCDKESIDIGGQRGRLRVTSGVLMRDNKILVVSYRPKETETKKSRNRR